MQKNGTPVVSPDLRLFDVNRSKFPAELLLDYHGKFVAWSPDGTRILAFGATREELDRKLDAAGIHYSQVVHDYIDPPLG